MLDELVSGANLQPPPFAAVVITTIMMIMQFDDHRRFILKFRSF